MVLRPRGAFPRLTKSARSVLPSVHLTTSALRFIRFRGSIARPTPAAPQRFTGRLAATGAWFAEKVAGYPLFLPGLSPGDIPPVSLAHQVIWQRIRSGALKARHIRRGSVKGLYVQLGEDRLPLFETAEAGDG